MKQPDLTVYKTLWYDYRDRVWAYLNSVGGGGIFRFCYLNLFFFFVFFIIKAHSGQKLSVS